LIENGYPKRTDNRSKNKRKQLFESDSGGGIIRPSVFQQASGF
jgi:hypothetical protein